MLEAKFVRENADVVRAAIKKKHMTVDLDRYLKLDEEVRKLESSWQEERAKQNSRGSSIRSLDGDDLQKARKELGEIKSRLKEIDKQLPPLKEERYHIASFLPSIPADDVPDGVDDKDNVELYTEGDIPTFDFDVIDHVTYGLDNELFDFERAGKIAGSRTYFLKNQGALLDLAIQRMAIDLAIEKGFSPMMPPMIVRKNAMFGTGYFPGGEDQSYVCERDEAWLVGTSEVPVTSYHSDEILNESDLPKRYAGISSCFRREAGAAGKDTRGLYRIHQFNKIEQVVICRNSEEDSIKHHDEILKNSKEILKRLELPYRVVNVCGGDLGQGQVQKFDIETWMPSRNAYGETHSASRFHEFQSRRLNLRYRDEDGKVHFCHTLNNTLIATPRVLIPMLEVHQQSDGSVKIPKALQPYTGFDSIQAIKK